MAWAMCCGLNLPSLVELRRNLRRRSSRRRTRALGLPHSQVRRAITLFAMWRALFAFEWSVMFASWHVRPDRYCRTPACFLPAGRVSWLCEVAAKSCRVRSPHHALKAFLQVLRRERNRDHGWFCKLSFTRSVPKRADELHTFMVTCTIRVYGIIVR